MKKTSFSKLKAAGVGIGLGLLISAGAAWVLLKGPGHHAAGVKVSVTREGTGAKPTQSDQVEIKYHGYLPTGAEFDSSERRASTVQFRVKNAIACWREALPQLKVGSQASVTCPATTAFGSQGAKGLVAGNTPLKFDIELVSIVKP